MLFRSREIVLLGSTLENTRNELGVVKEAANQLFGALKALEAPAALVVNEPAVIVDPAPVESTPVEVPVETATNSPSRTTYIC